MRKILTLNDVLAELKKTAVRFKKAGTLYEDLTPFLSDIRIDVDLLFVKTGFAKFGLASTTDSRKVYSIKLNGWALSSMPQDKWKDTVRHEYAHILHFIARNFKILPTSVNYQHDKYWQAYAIACGANPVAKSKIVGLGVLGRVIEVTTKKNNKFSLTYERYLKEKGHIDTSEVTFRIATAAEMIDKTLIPHLAKIKL